MLMQIFESLLSWIGNIFLILLSIYLEDYTLTALEVIAQAELASTNFDDSSITSVKMDLHI